MEMSRVTSAGKSSRLEMEVLQHQTKVTHLPWTDHRPGALIYLRTKIRAGLIYQGTVPESKSFFKFKIIYLSIMHTVF